MLVAALPLFPLQLSLIWLFRNIEEFITIKGEAPMQGKGRDQ